MVTSLSVGTKRAVGYERVSTAEQAGARHSSLETQESRIAAYCEARGLDRVASFRDVASGRRDDRGEYRRMVEFVRDGGAEVIVVQFLDRFGRHPKEILTRIWELQSFGVSVEATDEDIQEELILLIKAGIAGQESRRTSERVRANMDKAVARGVQVARPPYGLRPVREIKDGRVVTSWELDPVEAPVVREMYRLSAEENLGFKAAADRLSLMGYRAREGRPFTSFTLQRVLSNEAIMGTLAYGKRPKKGNPQRDILRTPGVFPAILTEEEWERLQQRLAIRRDLSRGKGHTSQYLLSGTVRCGHCGGAMVGKMGASYKGRRYRNYYCSSAMSSRAKCAYYNGHSAPKLEAAILEHLGQYVDPKIVCQLLLGAMEKEFKRRETELRQAEKRLTDLDADFQRNLALLKRGVLTEEEFAKANEATRAERSALEHRHAELAGTVMDARERAAMADSLPIQIGSFLEDFQAMGVHRQKAHLQTILKAAHIYRDGRIELEFRNLVGGS